MNILYSILILAALTGPGRNTAAFKDIFPVTDPALIRSLGGDWQLKVVEGTVEGKKVPAVDDSWGTIPVPGCWEPHGFSESEYSFPKELTGWYRTSFTVPSEWKGQRVILRLDGVLRGYELWINGKKAGSWEQAYNSCLFDITPFLDRQAFKDGAQELAMRVYSRYKGYEFDCNDDWAPMGIYRDVSIFPVPDIHLSDLRVTAGSDGLVNIDPYISGADRYTSVEVELLDAAGAKAGSAEKDAAGAKAGAAAGGYGLQIQVQRPRLWTAETPYLYTLLVRLTRKGEVLQCFEQKIGLRTLTIEGKVLKLNGVPIKLRGVTSHATDPWTGKVISEERLRQDLELMKAASINYIRTSHYPREPRFYELCDSLGIYVMDEVPFGSRGRAHLEDESYLPLLLSRAEATIRRDRNHPSVLIWSLGNENPLTDMCVRVGEYARSLDPTRPVCYPEVGTYFKTFNLQGFAPVAGIYAPHYPTTDDLATFYQGADRPVIFTEYCHTLGISFEDHDRQWEIIESTPALAGGSVWEWVDQGMPFREKLKDRFGYEERVFTSEDGGFEMSGNKGTDGLLYADRVPLPNYYELQHNYAQACVTDSVYTGVLHIRNRYDFVNLKDRVTFHWALTSDRDTVARGAFSPDCPPHGSVPYPLALPAMVPGRLSLLELEIRDLSGRVLLRQTLRTGADNPASLLAGALSPEDDPMELVCEGPMVRVGRKPTMSELMKVKDVRIERYLQPMDNPYVRAELSREGSAFSYSLHPGGERRFLSEAGIAFLLHAELDRIQWIGPGPYAAYPGRRNADRYGYWALHKDDLYFEGNRPGVDALWVSDAEGNGLLFLCGGSDVNFEQTDRGLVISINAAVSGEGPKFSQTAFGVWSDTLGEPSGSFSVYRTRAGQKLPLFLSPDELPSPFHPYVKQYDTYLSRYSDIRGVSITSKP